MPVHDRPVITERVKQIHVQPGH